jgi:periplasmic copper chaperone A
MDMADYRSGTIAAMNIPQPLNRFFVGAALAAVGVCAQAHEFKLGAIAIGHPYARATVPGQPAGGGFLKLENQGGADRLLSASANVSRSVELHTMSMDGDVMRMRQLDAIELPAGKTVELKPGGLHIMFMGLKAPLKAGDSFPLKLKFEKAGEVTVEVKVEAPGKEAMPKDMKH